MWTVASIHDRNADATRSAVRVASARELRAQRLMATLGASLVDAGPGRVVIELDHQNEFTQQDGYLHAGVMALAPA
jgi:acyl-coenzyme A thioesterase PaaI-like protein